MNPYDLSRADHPVLMALHVTDAISSHDRPAVMAIAKNPHSGAGTLRAIADQATHFPGVAGVLLANPSTPADVINRLVIDSGALTGSVACPVSAQQLVSQRRDLSDEALSVIWGQVSQVKRATFGHSQHKPAPLAYAIEHHPNCTPSLAGMIREWRNNRFAHRNAYHG